MADLRDREVAVDYEKNRSRMGPSGRRARSQDSAYLLVGGSRDIYNVTVNFEGKGGHWCETTTGQRCHGNGNGKSRTYGKPSERDRHNPQHWCKHVQAALADSEKLAEAQEVTAQAFGAPAPVKAQPPAPVEEPQLSDADKLAEIEAEAERLRERIAEQRYSELDKALAAFVADGFDYDDLKAAIKRVA